MVWDKATGGRSADLIHRACGYPLVCSSSQKKISAHNPQFQQLLTFHCLDIVRRLQRPWQQYSDRLYIFVVFEGLRSLEAMSEESASKVTLYVYDLSQGFAAQMSQALLGKQVGCSRTESLGSG